MIDAYYFPWYKQTVRKMMLAFLTSGQEIEFLGLVLVTLNVADIR